MNQFSETYWTERYRQNEASWDAGAITTPLKTYIDQLPDKNVKMLIPGAGNGHEAEYLFRNGFKNVSVIDISPEPIQNIQKRLPEFPSSQLITGDFFKHNGSYELILEQTFFCALDPSLQTDYAPQMNKLLKPGGKLAGLLFTDPLNNTTPPFALTKEAYIQLFQPYFKIHTLETCYNSIKPRQGRELFMILQKL
jgi:thiopurine S-methyltransferase